MQDTLCIPGIFKKSIDRKKYSHRSSLYRFPCFIKCIKILLTVSDSLLQWWTFYKCDRKIQIWSYSSSALSWCYEHIPTLHLCWVKSRDSRVTKSSVHVFSLPVYQCVVLLYNFYLPHVLNRKNFSLIYSLERKNSEILTSLNSLTVLIF